MKTRILTIIAAITLVLLSGCEKGRFLSSINGAPYELLVVADKSMWNTASGKALFGLLEWNNPETLGPMSVGGKILAALFQQKSMEMDL